ncbi:hypothetical protein [Methanopyrus sp.]
MTGTMLEEYVGAPIVEASLVAVAAYVVARHGVPALVRGEGEVDRRWLVAVGHALAAVWASVAVAWACGVTTPLTVRLAVWCSLVVLAVGVCPRRSGA